MNETTRRLLVAVAAAVKAAVAETGAMAANQEGFAYWPKVAVVMSQLTGEKWERKQAADCHRKYAKGKSREALAAIAASVDSETYREAVQSVVANGAAPHGAAPVIPQAKAAEDPTEPDSKVDTVIKKLQKQAEFFRKGYEKLLDEKADMELVLEKIGDAVEALPPVDVSEVPAPTVILWNRPRRLMPLLSDMHTAEKVEGSHIKGFNHYNLDVLDERLDTWCTEVEEHFQQERVCGPVEMIHIPMIGDMVTGENIYKGQWMHIEATAMHQIFLASDRLVAALLRLSKLGVPIQVDGVGGNHGRMGRKGESDFSNDFLMYKFLEARLVNQPNIRFNLDWAFWTTARHWDWRFYFCHGDNIRGWGGFPWYGSARADANTQQLMLTRGEWYHFFIHGHFHTDMSLQTPVGRRIANGNWIGTTEYGVNGGFTGRPSQKLLVITEEKGIESEITINLDKITVDFMNQTVAGRGMGMRPW